MASRELSWHVMRRPPLVQFHVSPELHRRLQRLRSERDINLSAWLRRLVARELDRELTPESDSLAPEPEPKTAPGPLPGWGPYKLEDKSWGSYWMGDTRKLPDDLVGCSIEVTTQKGGTWVTRVVEVLEWTPEFVLVRDAGKPSTAA